MKITEIIKKMEKLLLTIDADTYHYWADGTKSARYIQWQETGEGESLDSDNGKSEIILAFDIELYVLDPHDSAIDQVQEMLEANALSWSFDGTAYESDTGLIHHSWRCELG